MYVSKVVPLGLGTPGGETGRKEDAQSRGRQGCPAAPATVEKSLRFSSLFCWMPL